MPGSHALLSPSAASRWMACTASARATEGIEENTSTAAEEGTAAHALAEIKLKRALRRITKKKYETELEAVKATGYYNEEMEEHTDTYVNLVMEAYAEALSTTPDAVIEIETRLDFTDCIPEGFGTGDCIIIADGLIDVIDFKYGKGVEVDAEDNPQMMIYALGAIRAFEDFYDLKNARMRIIQPRLSNFPSMDRTVEDLHSWRDTALAPAAKAAWDGNGMFVPGEKQCRFCKINKTCKARADYHMALKDTYELEKANTLTAGDMATILMQVDDLIRWADSIKEYALERALEGDEIPGFKVVEGRSNRKITDEEAAVERLQNEGFTAEEIYNIKLKGITDLEKRVGKTELATILDGIIEKPPGKPALVPESDKRPALSISKVEDEFDFI